MGKNVSIYFPDKTLEWIDEQAEKDGRSRSNFIEKVLTDVKEGRLLEAEVEEAITRKKRLPPSART